MTEPTPSILIVDDRPEKLLSLETVLEDIGARIVLADSGRAALRAVLNEEFAVILLDVNMPGLDGFETAQMIRQRASSSHIPIIFLTAFGDDLHMTRGYSMGAVDYIQMPFIPEVLRTKVSVFVDVFRKTIQVKQQAASLQRRASQLQKLAAASVAINSTMLMPRLLQIVTDTARDIIGSHQAITLFLTGEGEASQNRTEYYSSFSDQYAEWRDHPVDLNSIADTIVVQSPRPTRLSELELKMHPDWKIVEQLKLPPVRGGVLAAPLRGGNGTSLGVIYLAERYEGSFTDDDEAIIVQLSQMASIAIENIIYSREREANRLKDEFLATLSHELRTPLSAIRGWTYLLRTEELTENARHGIDVIDRNTVAQLKLIEDLLDVSRITTGKLRLNAKRMPLNPLIEAAVESIQPAATEKGIAIDTRIATGAVEIHGDPDRIQQVIWNLLSNAVKFTPAGGNVTVLMEKAGDGVRIAVIDTGAGINRAFLPHVFDRFRQADSTSTRTQGGLGIGLTIVRHIVEMHGGSVAAESAGEKQGSIFTVTLPLAPVAGKTKAVAPNDPANEVKVRNLQGVRVLLIDDEQDAREVVGEILKRSNAEVSLAANVTDGLKQLISFRPHVVISDIAMPDSDGYDFVRRVRSLPTNQGGRTPAIALTAYARPTDKISTLEAGFQAHLAKPVTPSVLVDQVFQLRTNTSELEELQFGLKN